ncbi:hypothetical protein [Lacrimispora sp.]|uniref:hypothetical protein n=1 Tax=Lacrimispora sp. TaxID=2719234 RepID=UPI0028A789F5|nr:hypothetical protein [Lacrimispora sp.]
MKVQIDSNNYLTGNYCLVGDLDNSIPMEILPEGEQIYYTAYKIVSEEIENKIIVNEEVKRQREVKFPVFDEEGNETGEFNTEIVDYVEIEPVERITYETKYHYELDETKKKEIDDLIDKLPSDDGSKPITISDVSNRVTNVQVALCELYERLELS